MGADEGDWSVQIDVSDVAGNLAQFDAGILTLDFSPPVLLSSVVNPSSGQARPGELVSVVIEFDEALASVPNVVARGTTDILLSSVEQLGNFVSYVLAVEAGQDGDYELFVESPTDVAGNTPGDLSLGNLRIDGLPPSAQNVTFTPASLMLLASDTLVVEFESSEPLSTAPALDFGGEAMTRVGAGSTPYRYELDLSTVSLVGTYQVQGVFADVAGNSAVLSLGNAVVDAQPPALVNLFFSPEAVRLNLTAILTVTASETLMGNPVLEWDVDPGFSELPASGLNYNWGLAVDGSTPSGAFNLTRVTLTDAAGNVAEFTPPTDFVNPPFRVDNAAPVISSLTVNAFNPALVPPRVSPVSPHDIFTIDFGMDEDLTATGAALQVELGGTDITPSCLRSTAMPPLPPFLYSCSQTVVDDLSDSQTAELVLVTATDAAGNVASDSATVVVDRKAPDIASANVSYVPAPGSPLAVVEKAKEGAIIAVLAIPDEPIDTTFTPTLTIADGGPSIPLTAETPLSATFASFRGAVPMGSADGTYTPTLEWQDEVGNRNSTATFAIPTIEIKTSSPNLSVRQSQVGYLRSPWGNGLPENVGSFILPEGPYFELGPVGGLTDVASVPSDTFELTNGLMRMVRVYADSNKVTLLGSLMPDSGDGTWPRTQLATLDVPSVFVTGVDEAGNETDTTIQIRNLWEWDGEDWVELCTMAPCNMEIPEPREQAGMAYDEKNDVTVLFGGVRANGSLLRDVWEWDGTGWTRLCDPDGGACGTCTCTPANSPEALHDVGFAYDPATTEMLLQGGTGLLGEVGDCFLWSGTDWSTPTMCSEDARDGHTLTTDSGRGGVVLFGGKQGRVQRFWNGSFFNKDRTTDPDPGAPSDHAAVYDSTQQRMLVWGGINANAGLWALPSAPSRQTAIQFDVDASSVGLDLADLQAIDVRAHAGAIWSPFTVADEGAALYIWTGAGTAAPPGSWQAAATNGTGLTLPAAPGAAIPWTSSSPLQARQLLGPDASFHLQLRPDGPSGSVAINTSELSVDYVEIRLRYQVTP